MSVAGLQAPSVEAAIAEPDRRFYAFAIDRVIAWAIFAAAGVAAWLIFFRNGNTLAGTGLIAGVVLVVWLVGTILTGSGGKTPGKMALGLRVVSDDSGAAGRPIGVGKAFVRQALLGLCTIPTLGIGTATFAWVAAMDERGRRQGWHDRRAGSVVVDVRPPAVVEAEEEAPAPRRIVNLTTMRLKQAEATPERAERPQTPAAPTQSPAAHAAAAQAVAEAQAAPTQVGMPVARQAPPAPVPTPAPPAPPAPPAVPPVAQPAPPAPPTAAPQPAVTARWRVTFDTGQSFVVEGLAIVGRGPEPRPGEEVSHRVALSSSDMSLSKTHAQFQVAADGTLVVMDRGSTNGTTLIRQGAARALGARRPAALIDGDKVKFGDRTMDVVREA
ncbi:RDD family protein [Nocardioides luteus]|uniref:RDD family protein n=1 Tax=Nocardioides luteus TaxID=1844 RepID=UPI0018CABDC8|nr:RDD family protein [Nocardioides luteus]MBG6094672.1 putative RDD family membrane protein YckC [Nocardioides luteus]